MTATGDTSSHAYDADDANIQYSGRISFADPKDPKFSAPGVSITFAFKGVGATVQLEDFGNPYDYFDIVIDGGTPTKLKLLPTQTAYEVAKDLAYGDHVVTLVKRTEASIGHTLFEGLTIAGTIQPPPARLAHRIEFIGDSITAGTGNEATDGSAQCSEDSWGQPYQDSYLSYGPVAAGLLGAEYHLTAVSGIGLVWDYALTGDTRPMPAVYDLTFVELMTSPKWDTSQFVPDAIVINLGTNDFSPGAGLNTAMQRPAASATDKATWVQAYVDFIGKLRGYYPNVDIFAISSPMLGDGWPDTTYTSATTQRDCLTQVVDQLNSSGDTKVHKFFVDKVIGTGCGTHPNVMQDAMLASNLAANIKSTLGW